MRGPGAPLRVGIWLAALLAVAAAAWAGQSWRSLAALRARAARADALAVRDQALARSLPSLIRRQRALRARASLLVHPSLAVASEVGQAAAQAGVRVTSLTFASASGRPAAALVNVRGPLALQAAFVRTLANMPLPLYATAWSGDGHGGSVTLSWPG
ncbi:MAG: hypothetical protein K6V73_09895 [Firmicutes bacterium]|nr:hypothetical protein [Bacillota bacterium]